jgi:hypothetical protein
MPDDGTPNDAVRVLRFLEEHADEDFNAADIGAALGISPSSVAVILDYLMVFRPGCVLPERGWVRWSPLDDLFDRRLQARDLAEEIVRLLS